MLMKSYNDPTIVNWNTDENGNKIAVGVDNEPGEIIKGILTLNGIPDPQYKVFISSEFNEIDIKKPLTEIDQFKVDYTHGFVYFHKDFPEKSMTIEKYYSRGQWLLPATRIWTKIDDWGNVTQTLDDVTGKIDLIGSVVEDLADNISTAEGLTATIGDQITEAQRIEIALPLITTEADEGKDALDSTIILANNRKAALDGSINTSSNSKTALDTSVGLANTINNTLSHATTGTIKKATDINNTLNTSIGTANTSKTNLDTSVGVANTSKINLDGSVSIANTTKTGLDNSIGEGNALKGELAAIISGSDFENIITDLTGLKNDQHNHTNKAVLDDLTDASGYLQYKGADVGKMTGLVWGAFIA